MSKFIIREIEPEACDFSFYFDDDGLTEASGDFCNTLFIVPSRDFRGFNGDVYENVCRSALELSDMFEDIKFKGYYSSFYNSFKDCMIDNGIPYTSKKCHDLKSVLLNFDESPESVAAFLSVTTGKNGEFILHTAIVRAIMFRWYTVQNVTRTVFGSMGKFILVRQKSFASLRLTKTARKWIAYAALLSRIVKQETMQSTSGLFANGTAVLSMMQGLK